MSKSDISKLSIPIPKVNIDIIPKKDVVNHPSHYIANGIEVLDVIEAFDLSMHLGNCVKYILRAGRKNKRKTLEDLKKAQFYLNRHIANLEKVK